LNPSHCVILLASFQFLVSSFVSSALAVTRHADVNSTNPVPPYTNWATAATTIQQAVDAAEPGDTVLVAEGDYDAGGDDTGILGHKPGVCDE
jgi:hypothetical protein